MTSILALCGAREPGTGRTHLQLPAQMFYKSARVEYHPLGVVGAIVPWNYPFHNVFNPLTAALFAGNALVIKVSPSFGNAAGCAVHVATISLQYLSEHSAYAKYAVQSSTTGCAEYAKAQEHEQCMQVSEHASWSSKYYGRIISAALTAVGETKCLPLMHCASPELVSLWFCHVREWCLTGFLIATPRVLQCLKWCDGLRATLVVRL